MAENRGIEEMELITTYPINDVLLSQSTSDRGAGSSATMSIATKFVTKPGGVGQNPSHIPTRSYTKASSAKSQIPPGSCETGVIKSESNEESASPSSSVCIGADGNPALDHRLTKNSCHLCNKEFVYAFALKRHLANHNSQVYSCNQCSKTFKHQSTLLQHKAVHSVNFPYSCDLCQKSFNRISTLKSHRNIHSGVKPFVCTICNKGFHQKGNLKNHLYIHTNERPYRCDICERGFNQMSNLVCHKRNAHRVVQSVFYCQFCDLHFNRIEQLNSHELETHLRPTKTIYMETDTQMVRVKQVVESQADGEEEEEVEDHLLPPPPPLTSIKMLEPARRKPEIHRTALEATPSSSFVGFSSSSSGSASSAYSPSLSIAMINDVPIMEEEVEELATTTVANGNKYSSSSAAATSSSAAAPSGLKNCQMIFEKTENHAFFSKFSVIELPQKIDTLEMRYAEMTNKTPFAMLHFGADPPCLVEIVQQRGMRTILKPIKKHDLNHLTFSPAAAVGAAGDEGKGVGGAKIVITIVATIYQSFTKGEFSLFTVKSPEVVRCVKLLVDLDPQHSGGGGHQCPSCVVTNCAREDELRELKNKITIAITDYKPEIKTEIVGVGE